MQPRKARRTAIAQALKARGIQPATRAEALARLGDGDRLFVFHPMDEEPHEVTAPAILANYLPEQMLALTMRAPIRRPDDTGLPMAWGTFNDGEIQRDDEADIFEDDDEAAAYVSKRAAEGSYRHRVALAKHLKVDARLRAERDEENRERLALKRDAERRAAAGRPPRYLEILQEDASRLRVSLACALLPGDADDDAKDVAHLATIRDLLSVAQVLEHVLRAMR